MCPRQIKKKVLQGNPQTWWSNDLARLKAILRRKRQRWQHWKSEDSKACFLKQRNIYKKAIRKAKEDHIEMRVQNMIERPWFRT